MADVIIAVGVVVFLLIPAVATGALAFVFSLSILKEDFDIDLIERFRKKKEDTDG